MNDNKRTRTITFAILAAIILAGILLFAREKIGICFALLSALQIVLFSFLLIFIYDFKKTERLTQFYIDGNGDESLRLIKLPYSKGFYSLLTLQKKRSEEKIMLINDTKERFEDYEFTTNNAKFEHYNINNAINVTKPGMIQFSKISEKTENSPWFILLVR